MRVVRRNFQTTNPPSTRFRPRAERQTTLVLPSVVAFRIAFKNIWTPGRFLARRFKFNRCPVFKRRRKLKRGSLLAPNRSTTKKANRDPRREWTGLVTRFTAGWFFGSQERESSLSRFNSPDQ